ncbi:putative repeat protein (TIGR03833 family) [Salsuginibacillus halophilus]|uniref:Putative repeat protein (TIGR03833 family) n=1 Tax=Salsuginibacillus halophilus TaxID=517424 RepID=A0A2P8HVY0_9BACI|nr:YwbE family protein [Salsuginibacillus halophilus]PSL50392.1 putative repeat protein (TIGR03833 family) [Salsuginibacillus halophilus]
MSENDGTKRTNIEPGKTVDVVQKADQRSGKTTRGTVQQLLTKAPTHPHGIKVRLTDGTVGRVKQVIEE